MFEEKRIRTEGKEEPLGDGFDEILITRRLTEDYLRSQGLGKVWPPNCFWALGTGTVTAWFYAHWGMALGKSTPVDFLTAFFLATVIYLVYLAVMTELAVIFPFAGGAYAYVRRGIGKLGGYAAGVLLALCLLFACAAVLMLLQGYLSMAYPGPWRIGLSLLIFASVIAGQAADLRISAWLQFFFTCCALGGLVLFLMAVGPVANTDNLSTALAGALTVNGLAVALPTVLWFYLGLEGLSNAAEETKNVEKRFTRGVFISFGTVFFLAAAVMALVFSAIKPGRFAAGAYPLVDIIRILQPTDHILMATFSAVSICAFIASLNGLTNGYSRQVYALARAGYFPRRLSRLAKSGRTPILAILLPALAVIVVFLSGQYRLAVVAALLSALVLQGLVLLSFIKIYRSEPELFGFSGVLYRFGLVGAALVLLTMGLGIIAFYNIVQVGQLLPLWGGLIALFFFRQGYIQEEAPEESRAVSLEKSINIHFH